MHSDIQNKKPSAARFAKYLERSGLTIVRLTADCNFDDAVRFYVKLQTSNPFFISLGIVGEKLQKYAEFLVKTGSKFPFSIVAIDNNMSGRIEGIFIVVILSEVDNDDSELCDGAEVHWRILYLSEKAMKEHGKYNKYYTGVIMGWMPKHQGKGLFMDMTTTSLDDLMPRTALGNHMEGFTLYTANPNFLRAFQKMLSPGT